jgi:hypothetical protein
MKTHVSLKHRIERGKAREKKNWNLIASATCIRLKCLRAKSIDYNVKRQMRRRASPLYGSRGEARAAISEVEVVTLGKVQVRVQATLPRVPVKAAET